MSQPSDDHKFLDGPGFVEWLMDVRPELEGRVNAVLGDSIQRRIYDWTRGSCPEAFDVPDRICVKLGLHLDDIPDEIWRVDRLKSRTWEKRKALEMLSEGYFVSEIAHSLGVSARTVYNWRAQAEGQVAA